MHEPDITATIPASGAWRVGDDPGYRQFADLGTLLLESGESLPVTLAYETWGELNAARDNAVLVLHALTGDSHVTSHGGSDPGQGWWSGIVGPGKVIDTDRYFVIAPNILGGCQGSTGPASIASDGDPYGARFPHVTARDQVLAESLLADQLDIAEFCLVVGASMGGHRALEWAISRPHRVRRLAVIASGARTTADQIALGHTQLLAIEGDPNFVGGNYYDRSPGTGPWYGLGLARRIAHLSYRTAGELDARFGRLPQGREEPLDGGRFAVQSYLDHHGAKLARRFDANSYITLTRAMLTHDVGRDRGGVRYALGKIQARTLVIAIDSDRLFPVAESALITDAVRNAFPLALIASQCGHDGFLVENDAVAHHLARLLDSVPARREQRQSLPD